MKSSNLVNGRCHLVPFVSTLNELKKHMSQRHWEIIDSTPFSHLMHLPPIVQERGLLDGLLQLYDAATNKFKIGKDLVSFRAEDISLILGLPCNGVMVDFKCQNPLSAFQEMYLKDSKDRHRDNINKKLLEIVHDRSEEENFVKLLLAYIMASFLFPHTTSSTPKWVGQYVDQLYSMGQYAWAHAVHIFMMNDVLKAASCVKARCLDANMNIGYVRGCVIALIIWFYEVTGTGKKVYYGKIPRILCYGDKKFRKTASVAALLDSLSGREISNLMPLNQTEVDILGTTRARARVPMNVVNAKKDEEDNIAALLKETITQIVDKTFDKFKHKLKQLYQLPAAIHPPNIINTEKDVSHVPSELAITEKEFEAKELTEEITGVEMRCLTGCDLLNNKQQESIEEFPESNIDKDTGAAEQIEKHNRYMTLYSRRLRAKYFSKKVFNGASNIFDQETTIDGETIISSRWPCTSSFADPIPMIETKK